VFSAGVSGPLFSVSERGGTPKPATEMESRKAHRWPWMLPDGRHFLYSQPDHFSDQAAPGGLYVGSLDGEKSILISSDSGNGNGLFASGRLIYVQDRSLIARPFDPNRLQFTGAPIPIVDQELDQDLAFGRAPVSVSATGVVIFQSASDASSELVWFTADGVRQGALPAPGARSPQISPDGKFVAVSSDEAGNGKRFVRVHDLRRGVATRLTSGGREEVEIWSSDGKKIAYASWGSPYRMYEMRVDQAGEPVLLREGARMTPNDYSPDGRYLTYMIVGDPTPHLEILDTEEGESFPLDVGIESQFSPDGKWLAYSSRRQIVVQPFPPTGKKIQISSLGGGQPRWSRDGGKLYFIAFDRKLMEASIEVHGGTLSASAPRVLFQTHIMGALFSQHQYDVSPVDGCFLINTLRPEAPLTLISNWPAMLQK
jgi:WD40 repeat protein